MGRAPSCTGRAPQGGPGSWAAPHPLRGSTTLNAVVEKDGGPSLGYLWVGAPRRGASREGHQGGGGAARAGALRAPGGRG